MDAKTSKINPDRLLNLELKDSAERKFKARLPNATFIFSKDHKSLLELNAGITKGQCSECKEHIEISQPSPPHHCPCCGAKFTKYE